MSPYLNFAYLSLVCKLHTPDNLKLASTVQLSVFASTGFSHKVSKEFKTALWTVILNILNPKTCLISISYVCVFL